MLTVQTVRGAVWLVFARFLGRLIDFVTLLILARMLTPADFGITALAMTLIVIVDVVLEVPVTQALLRLNNLEQAHFDTGFTLGVLRGLLISVLVLAAAWPFSLFYEDGRLFWVLVLLAIGPIARGLFSPHMVTFARDLSFQRMFVAEVAGKLCAFPAAIGTVLLGGGYWAIVTNLVVSAVAITGASYVLAPYRPRLTLSKFVDFSSFVGWFSSAQVVAALNWQFDRVLLGKCVDRATIGRYAVASDIAVLPSQSLIGPAMQPVMAAFAKLNREPQRLQSAFLKAARFAMLVSVPSCIGIALTADLIVALLLGPKWREAGPLLQLLALTVVTMPYCQTLYSISLALDRPQVLFRLNLIDFAQRLGLITLGLYFFGVMGVVVARVVISAIMFIFYMLNAYAVVGTSVAVQLKNLWKIAGASLVMAASVNVVREGLSAHELNAFVELCVSAAVGGAAYLGALYASGVQMHIDHGRVELADRWW